MPVYDSNYKRRLKRLLKRFDIVPKNIDLYCQAFTHTSVTTDPVESYELLEFLGDSVILVHVNDVLIKKYPTSKVGLLSKAKSQIVSGESFANVVRDLKLDKYLLVDQSILKNTGKISPSILADCFESFVAAIFLDQGYRKTRGFLNLVLTEVINIDLQERREADYKSILQEEVQKIYKQVPQYDLEKTSGPDHDKTFYVRVSFHKVKMGRGGGKSKKDAEQEAANKTLKKLKYYFQQVEKTRKTSGN